MWNRIAGEGTDVCGYCGQLKSSHTYSICPEDPSKMRHFVPGKKHQLGPGFSYVFDPDCKKCVKTKERFGSKGCKKDEQGFHVDENGRRTIERDGRDAYARRCTQCGTIGYPSRDWSRFIEGEDGWKYR